MPPPTSRRPALVVPFLDLPVRTDEKSNEVTAIPRLSPDYLCHVLGLPNDYRPRLPSKGPRAAPKG